METNEQSNLNIKTILKYSTVEFVDTNESYIQKGVVGDFIEYPNVERVVEPEWNTNEDYISIFYKFEPNYQVFKEESLIINVRRHLLLIPKFIDWTPNQIHFETNSLKKIYFKLMYYDEYEIDPNKVYKEINLVKTVNYSEGIYSYTVTIDLPMPLQENHDTFETFLHIYYDEEMCDELYIRKIEINPCNSNYPGGD